MTMTTMTMFKRIGNHSIQEPEWNESFFSLRNIDDIKLWPNGVKTAHTGFSVNFSSKYYGLILPDNNLLKRGIILLTTMTESDEEITVTLWNRNLEGQSPMLLIPPNTVIGRLIFLDNPSAMIHNQTTSDFQLYGTIP